MKFKKSAVDMLAKKQQHDQNLILKLIGEIGDLVRIIRQMEARVEKLEKQLNGQKKVREGKSGGQG